MRGAKIDRRGQMQEQERRRNNERHQQTKREEHKAKTRRKSKRPKNPTQVKRGWREKEKPNIHRH